MAVPDAQIVAALADAQTIDARVARVESEINRLRDEVEACSVLVLSLDSASSLRPSLGQETALAQTSPANEEVNRLIARLNVLEEAWSLRRERASDEMKAEVERLEAEVLDLWKALRRQEDIHLPQLRSQHDQLAQTVQMFRNAEPSTPVDIASIDRLMDSFANDVGGATSELSQRCAALEDAVAQLVVGRSSVDDDRQRLKELQQMIEILVQQRREDITATNSQLKEVAAKFAEIDRQEERSNSWRLEADKIHQEIEDLRVEKLPSITAQTSRSARLLADGLQALREELLRLSEQVDAVRSGGGGGSKQVATAEVGQELAEVKAQVDELRHQVVRTLSCGIEDRFVDIRTQLAAEVEAVQRKCKAEWVDASRRLSALEPWQADAANLYAEVQAIRTEQQEDRVRWGLALQDEMLALRAGVTEGLERRFTKLDKTLASREGITDRIEARLAVISSDMALSKGSTLPSQVAMPVALQDSAVQPLPRSRPAELRSDALSPGPAPPLQGSSAMRVPLLGAGAPTAVGSSKGPEEQVLVVSGKRVEWSISAASMQAASSSIGPLVSKEVDVAGCLCTLKFFPKGSPMCKGPAGTCSLYLSVSNQKVVRFHVFAGQLVSPLLECTFDRRRDQGRHDLCLLQEVMDAQGGVLVGAELVEVSD